MPHRCVKCSKTYADNSPQLLQGCSCGNRIFLFLRADRMSLKELYEIGSEMILENSQIVELSQKQPVSVEIDLKDANAPAIPQPSKPAARPQTQKTQENQQTQKTQGQANEENNSTDEEAFEDLGAISAQEGRVENITIHEKGNYELNLNSLMKGEPLVVRSQSGVYYVKLQAYKQQK